MLRTALLAAAAAFVAAVTSHNANATLIFRFEPTDLQVPLPEPPQPNGLQAIDAEIGIADEALSRSGALEFSDLEYVRFAYTPLPDEFGGAFPAKFEFGQRFGTDIVPDQTEFGVRTGYVLWRGVTISGDTLLFSPGGVSLSVADACFDVVGQIFCEGDKGRAFISPLDPGSEPGMVQIGIRDEFTACNEFLPSSCSVQGRFVLADSAVQVAEPPTLAFVGLAIIGMTLRRRVWQA
jgi:hypothetical protein